MQETTLSSSMLGGQAPRDCMIFRRSWWVEPPPLHRRRRFHPRSSPTIQPARPSFADGGLWYWQEPYGKNKCNDHVGTSPQGNKVPTLPMEAGHNVHRVIQDTGCRSAALCGNVPCGSLQKYSCYQNGGHGKILPGLEINWWIKPGPVLSNSWSSCDTPRPQQCSSNDHCLRSKKI